jgi:hypothetical protein
MATPPLFSATYSMSIPAASSPHAIRKDARPGWPLPEANSASAKAIHHPWGNPGRDLYRVSLKGFRAPFFVGHAQGKHRVYLLFNNLTAFF